MSYKSLLYISNPEFDVSLDVYILDGTTGCKITDTSNGDILVSSSFSSYIKHSVVIAVSKRLFYELIDFAQ